MLPRPPMRINAQRLNDPPLHGLAVTIVPKGGVTLFVILLPEVHPGQPRSL